MPGAIRPSANAEVIESRVAHLWRRDDGIICLVYKPKAQNTLPDNKRHLEIEKRLSQGESRIFMLVDATDLAGDTREARKFGAGPDFAEFLASVAVLVPSPIPRLLGRFFIAVTRPPYPVQLFDREQPAIRWLLKQRALEQRSGATA